MPDNQLHKFPNQNDQNGASEMYLINRRAYDLSERVLLVMSWWFAKYYIYIG